MMMESAGADGGLAGAVTDASSRVTSLALSTAGVRLL